MNNKPQLIDHSILTYKHNPLKRKIKISKEHSKGFSLDIVLIVIFVLFGVYLYAYRKRDTQQAHNKTRVRLQHLQNLNYQYFTNNS